MELVTKEQFISNSSKIFVKKRFEFMDLSYYNLQNIKFYYCDLSNVILNYCNLENCSFENCLLDNTSLHHSKLKNANLKSASMRFCNLSYCDIRGAYLYSAILENANLDGIVYNDDTKWFKLHCPENGAFIAYKKALDNKLIKLLIPNDALRTSATMESCRCNKAKVLAITDFSEKIHYDDAWSFVDENFCYKVGETVTVKNFNSNRWFDSTTGIHFWMTKRDAIKY